jgi:hypothetical protein
VSSAACHNHKTRADERRDKALHDYRVAVSRFFFLTKWFLTLLTCTRHNRHTTRTDDRRGERREREEEAKQAEQEEEEEREEGEAEREETHRVGSGVGGVREPHLV